MNKLISIKKVILVFLAVLLVVSSVTVVSAKNTGKGTVLVRGKAKYSNTVSGSRARKVTPTGKTVLDKTLIETNKKIATDIANGSNTLVGGGVPFDFPTNTQTSEVTPLWQSDGSNHTHQYLAARGAIILQNDMGTNVSNYIFNYINNILAGADSPDSSFENDGGTYLGHFYDPLIGTNYLGQTSPTAKSRFVAHMNIAINYYWSDRQYAMTELGRAMHYLADLDESHHAANIIAGPTSTHQPYEQWVDTNRLNYQSNYGYLYQWVWNSTYDQVAYDTAMYSRGFVSDVTKNDTDKYSYWDNAAYNTINDAQQAIAAVYYAFLYDVGEDV